MPTYWVDPKVPQNSLRFRNLLKEAAERLSKFGFYGSEADALLAGA